MFYHNVELPVDVVQVVTDVTVTVVVVVAVVIVNVAAIRQEGSFFDLRIKYLLNNKTVFNVEPM